MYCKYIRNNKKLLKIQVVPLMVIKFSFPQDLGIPLIVDLKIQLNLVIKSTNYVKRIQKFNDLTLPVFWINLVRSL